MRTLKKAPPARFALTTNRLVGGCSIF